MNFSQLLTTPCDFESACSAASVPLGSSWGTVIISLMEQLETARKIAAASGSESTRFRAVSLVDGDAVIRRLAATRLTLCDECDAKVKELLRSLGAAGVITDPQPDADSAQAVAEMAQRLKVQ
jgi:hypothetical protein